MPAYPAIVVSTARHLHDLLASRRYSELESICRGNRLSASELEAAVRHYGCTVCEAPQDLPSDVLRIDAPERKWAVDVPIFTKEKGMSDLTLTVTMTESRGELCDVEIDDLHVL